MERPEGLDRDVSLLDESIPLVQSNIKLLLEQRFSELKSITWYNKIKNLLELLRLKTLSVADRPEESAKTGNV